MTRIDADKRKTLKHGKKLNTPARLRRELHEFSKIHEKDNHREHPSDPEGTLRVPRDRGYRESPIYKKDKP